MNIRFNCLFYLEKEAGKEDAKLKMRVRWGKNIITFNPGYRIEVKNWSTETQRCKNNTTNGQRKISATTINKEIQSWRNAVEESFIYFERQNRVPCKDELRKRIEIILGIVEPEDTSLYALFDKFVESEGMLNGWKENTFKKMTTLKNHLIAYNSKLAISDLNNDTLQGIVRYFLRNNYRNTTILKHIAQIKWFIRWLYKNEYYEGKIHETFSPKIHNYDKVVVYLSWEELMRVYTLNLPAFSQLDNIRNVFCFCCFTSLRYSDVYALTRDDVKSDYIQVVTKKTDDNLTINLNKHSKSILDKYKDYKTKGNKALPVYANQVMNRGLKEIGKRAELFEKVKMVSFSGSRREDDVFEKWEILTMHCARRTFVVNAMYLGIPEDVIRTWTGHSTPQAMKPYKKIVDELKQNEMDKFNRD